MLMRTAELDQNTSAPDAFVRGVRFAGRTNASAPTCDYFSYNNTPSAFSESTGR
jgi:hypothetical protein